MPAFVDDIPDYLVQHGTTLRFRDETPDFEHVVDLWKRAARETFDVARLDWSSLSNRVRSLMANCAAPWPWAPSRMQFGDEVICLPTDPNQKEMIALVHGLSIGAVAPDFVDWDAMTPRIRNLIWVFSRYEIRRLRSVNEERRRGAGQKRAMGLLHSLLTSTQLRSQRRHRYFLVNGVSTGHVYRIRGFCGQTERVTKHGSRWFAHTRFCLHDPEIMLPPADVAVSHLLLIRSDEARFLDLANATDARGMAGLWNGDWLRRLASRRNREAGIRA